MAEFEKSIINRLLDKYEKSKLSKGGSNRNIKIKLTLNDNEMKTYKVRDSYKYRESNNIVIRELEKKDFINVVWDDDDFEELTLNVDNVNKLYKYANRENPKEELDRVISALNKNKQDGFLGEFIEANLACIQENFCWLKAYFTSAGQLEDILKGIRAISKLEKETKIRDFSVSVYGDSKYFDNIKGKVARVIKDFDPTCTAEDTDDILAEYNIIKNSTYALIKNNLSFRLNNSVIDLNDLIFEYSLSDEMIENMEMLSITAKKVITVENLTSFYKLEDKEAIIIYLGGFHNHTKRLLLEKIYKIAPYITYLHFGDIDAGGIYIYDNLVKATAIPFEPYKMGIDEIKKFANFGKQLTQHDKDRLFKMRQDARFIKFKEVIDYMLNNNIKLEQEIMD